jgi:hypothetical protein
MPEYNSQRLGTANTFPNSLFVLFFCYSCCFVVNRDVLLLFMCKCVLPPGVNPIAVDKYIKYQRMHANDIICIDSNLLQASAEACRRLRM